MNVLTLVGRAPRGLRHQKERGDDNTRVEDRRLGTRLDDAEEGLRQARALDQAELALGAVNVRVKRGRRDLLGSLHRRHEDAGARRQVAESVSTLRHR